MLHPDGPVPRAMLPPELGRADLNVLDGGGHSAPAEKFDPVHVAFDGRHKDSLRMALDARQ